MGGYTRIVKRDASRIVSVLLVVLLAASPLVGPVCAMLCGHPVGNADQAHDVEHAHPATHGAHNTHGTAHGHGTVYGHAGSAASAGQATADARVFDVAALSSGAFDIASTVLAAARLQPHASASDADASETGLIARHAVVPHTAPLLPVPPPPDVSSARPPLVLRI